MINQMFASGVLHYFAGVENWKEDGRGPSFNWILSNGARSTHKEKNWTYYTHMMPEGSHKMIRSVCTYSGYNFIQAFVFLDKEGALLWKVGETRYSGMKVETVFIAESELIVGLTAK